MQEKIGKTEKKKRNT